MTLWHETLSALIPIVAAKLAEYDEQTAGASATRDYEDWRRRTSAAEKALVEFFREQHDGRITERSGAYRVRIAGVQASSTISYCSAVHNWKRAAENRLAGAAGEVQRGA